MAKKLEQFFNLETKQGIEAVLKHFMDNVLQRRLVDEPWDYQDYQQKLPFHVALVPEEIWKGAKFERSFVTSLGMIGWEDIARIVANDKRGYAKRGEKILGTIYLEKLRKIQEIIRELEHGGRKPDWQKEILEIGQVKGKEITKVTVVADLYVEDESTKDKLAFEIKSPLPNSDQTRVSKEKILILLHLIQPQITGAFFALPFNPFGTKDKYAHSHPGRWFNMKNDDVVIMATDFWDLLGGKGTYEALIQIFEEVGNTYKDRIRKEYLGISE